MGILFFPSGSILDGYVKDTIKRAKKQYGNIVFSEPTRRKTTVNGSILDGYVKDTIKRAKTFQKHIKHLYI